MKKQLLTFSMCLACMSALNAQNAGSVYYKLGKVTDWTQVKSGDKIVIESVSTSSSGSYERNGFFQFVPANEGQNTEATVTFNRANNYGTDFVKSFGFLTNTFDANKVFVIEQKSEGSEERKEVYALKCIETNMYLKNNSQSGNAMAFVNENTHTGFVFTKDDLVEGAWNVACDGSNLKFDANSDAPTLYNAENPRPFNIYKVTEEKITYSNMPWSYIAMFATTSDPSRLGRCIQVGKDSDETILYNQEGVIDASNGVVNSGENKDKQLWRFEESDTETGRFAWVNKSNQTSSVGKVTNGGTTSARYHYGEGNKIYQFELGSANGKFNGTGFVNFKRHDGGNWFVNGAANGQKYYVNEYDKLNEPGFAGNAWSIVVTSELKSASNLNGTAIGTFSAPYAVYVPAGLTAYVVTGESNDYITLTEVTYNGDTKILPANTGVILTCETAGFYPMLQTNVAATANNIEGNRLKASGSDRVLTSEGGVYVLGANQSNAGMYRYTAKTIAPFKAYLPKATTETAQVKSIQFPGDGTTGIEETVTGSENSNAPIYNLNGQRVVNPTKGVYIQNGKKFTVK